MPDSVELQASAAEAHPMARRDQPVHPVWAALLLAQAQMALMEPLQVPTALMATPAMVGLVV